MKNTLYIFALFLFAFSCKSATSKDTILDLKPSSDTLTFRTGVRCILQDSKGNYWFGSHQEGLAKYDGKTFNYFTMENGLSNLQIRSIEEDANGTIWIGTGDGVCRYNGNFFEKIMTNPLHTNTQNWNAKETDLWFSAGNTSGIYRFDGLSLSHLKFPNLIDSNTAKEYLVTSIAHGKEQQVWMSTYNEVFGYNGKEFVVFTNDKLKRTKSNGTLHVRSVFEDSKGRLWIGNNGIGVLLHESDSTIHFSEKMNLIASNSFHSGKKSAPGTMEHVFCIMEDPVGNIWFGDRDNGAWKYDGRTITNQVIDSKLVDPMIYCIYTDSAGNLLFGMAQKGVYRYTGTSFERIF